MLKAIKNSYTFNSYEEKIICAEIYVQKRNIFTIVCVACEMKIFDFADFLIHFKNAHNSDNELQTTEIKGEMQDVLQENLLETDVCKDNMDIDDNCNSNSIDCDDYYPESNANSSDDTDEPQILKKRQLTSTTVSGRGGGGSITQCEYCDKSYRSGKLLELHIKNVHKTSATYQCPNCVKKFKYERSLNSHLRKQHTEFPCDKCDKVYKSKESLVIHNSKHGERKFICDYANCGKAFFNKKHLCGHKRMVHIAERNTVCEICGYRTKIKSYLSIHMRSAHTGERPFKCEICQKGFASYSLLKEHIPIHSKDRPHECNICSATFVAKKALYHHKFLHSDKKQFVCKLCGKAYSQAAGLSGHMRQHKSDLITTTRLPEERVGDIK